MSRFSGTDINCSMKRQALCDDADGVAVRGKERRKRASGESVVAEAGSERDSSSRAGSNINLFLSDATELDHVSKTVLRAGPPDAKKL